MSLDLAPYLQAVEAELRDVLAQHDELTAPLYGMMRYHMGWADAALQPVEAPRGKRLRPVFCLLACEAAGGDWRRAVPAAADVELIHNFSLIHDDIEDNSAERRHRATVWSLWGLAQGVNTGDTMWILSQLAMQRLLDLGHGAEAVLAVVRTLNQAVLELCTGQYLDLAFESQSSVAVSQYERMIRGKTGALLAGAMRAGAILAGAPDQVVGRYSSFGLELGLAFQITDDILGIWGDPGVTGKSAAGDILTRKKTLPVLHALATEAQRGQADLAQRYARPLTQADVPFVLTLLERAGAREAAEVRAREHLAHALVHLNATHGGLPASEMLRHLADSLADRTA
ncbi:MAG: polyprenyl synthetase family protein [Chloroflexi bacterium]|nr:polyprenyl synthetase family protein [Chloroflexota bacterium]